MKLSRCAGSEVVRFEDVDLVDPALYSNGDPHPIWKAMRERAPVHWQSSGTSGFWSITRWEDANRVLRDPAAFTSQRGTMLGMLGVHDPAAGVEMTVTDPPRHTQMRTPLQRALGSAMLEPHADRLRADIRELWSPALDGEPFDAAATAMTVSATVASLVLGLPKEDRAQLARLSFMAIAPDDRVHVLPAGRQATLAKAHRELFAYFDRVTNERRRSPGEDLISVMLDIRIDGKSMGQVPVVANCYSVLLGAMVTTPHVISGALLEMIENGGYDDWATDPALIGSGVEEALRWVSPGNHFMRYAKADVEINGTRIREGDAVVVWLGSANRDADVFEKPYEFDVRRNPNRHVAFGVGPHYCVGHAAARLALRITFEELFGMFLGFELTGPVEHLGSNFIAGITRLPLVARRR